MKHDLGMKLETGDVSSFHRKKTQSNRVFWVEYWSDWSTGRSEVRWEKLTGWICPCLSTSSGWTRGVWQRLMGMFWRCLCLKTLTQQRNSGVFSITSRLNWNLIQIKIQILDELLLADFKCQNWISFCWLCENTTNLS